MWEIKNAFNALNIEGYRAQQISEWIYKKNIYAFSQMTNFPLKLRALLEENFMVSSVKLLEQQISKDGKTMKFLLEFEDGVAVETVLMRQSYGNSVCVSTQAGCNMGCVFCASTMNGMTRNLTQGEILAQVLFIHALLTKENQKVNTIVIMGAGEPLANYKNVINFIRLCHEDYIFNLGYRNITLSTSGIVPMIDELITEDIPITLSISLHASNNHTRSELMPINSQYNIEELVSAGRNYALQTGRRVTYEYILIENVNDSLKDAAELAKLLRGQLANVNLIPINPIMERGLNRPSLFQINQFEKALSQRNINVTVRREMGNDIQAACGQLRNKHLDN